MSEEEIKPEKTEGKQRHPSEDNPNLFKPGQSGRKVMGKYFVSSRRKANTQGNKRGNWWYQEDRPNCIHCGRKARYHTKNPDGSVKYWRNVCTMCHKNQGQLQYKYRLYKKDYCEKCGFVAVNPIQLDVDHIDGNHKNNQIDNLQTLCANCHRLKTISTGEHNGEKFVLFTGEKLKNYAQN